MWPPLEPTSRTLRAQGYKPEGFGVDGEPESRMRRVMTGGNYYSVEVRNEPVAEDPEAEEPRSRRSRRSLWSRIRRRRGRCRVRRWRLWRGAGEWLRPFGRARAPRLPAVPVPHWFIPTTAPCPYFYRGRGGASFLGALGPAGVTCGT